MKAYIRHLVAMFAAFFGAQTSVTPSAVAQNQDQDGLEWGEAKAAGTLEALEGYLARYPVGPYSREAFREIIRRTNCDDPGVPGCEDIGGGDPILPPNPYPSVSALY